MLLFIAYSGNTQPDWFDSRRPNPELKVTCFREKKDEITEEYYWDLLPERRRSFIENAE